MQLIAILFPSGSILLDKRKSDSSISSIRTWNLVSNLRQIDLEVLKLKIVPEPGWSKSK